MILENLVVTENKVLKNKQLLALMGKIKETQEPTEVTPNGQIGDNWSNKINKIVLQDYNLKYTTNIDESTLT